MSDSRSTLSGLTEGQHQVKPVIVLALPVLSSDAQAEKKPLISPSSPSHGVSKASMLEERPLYAINFSSQSPKAGHASPQSQSLKREWMEAKMSLAKLTRPMYICALIQIVAEAALFGTGLFNLIDWLIAVLGACSCLLVLSSCCTLLETGLFYAVLLNLLAIVLEFIPIGNFIADGVEHVSDRKGVFGLFPSYSLNWRFALVFAAYEFVVSLIRIASTICTWRYREAVGIVSEYNEQQQKAERRRVQTFKAVGDAFEAMHPHAPNSVHSYVTVRETA